MINLRLIKVFKRIAIAVIATLLFVMGYIVGDSLRAKQHQQATTQQKVQETPKEKTVLQYEQVKEFLIVYYTKKQLEENRNRYKPFMTEGLYQMVVDEENTARQQAYKGYIVDQEFEDAIVYISADRREVIATVKYTYTILEKKGDYSKKLNQHVTETIKMSYVEKEETLLVNRLEKVTLDTPKTTQ
ncbi:MULTISPECIES: hypothetical protein [unclassified Granulicatella]|uniref:hypothetical protein n=1 Tax=unclassified Granulicatella TaxID=2630493 RepID=UPI0010735232|nr:MULTISPECIES: hypothetical protein [unclassified Granulicatella]MBF0780595.1 hypothetical protein [Granulicatella sp. 19428wC4_WM01]TFU94623.1 hypothetical protein E4T68_05730 [Granulicatella sp. WM01]